MITSKLVIPIIVAPSQVQKALERLGAKECKWVAGGSVYSAQAHFDYYFFFTLNDEKRQLQYFMSPMENGCSLSVNWWGSDEAIMSTLKGAFGGEWFRDDEAHALEAAPGYDDILDPTTTETHLMMHIFDRSFVNAVKLDYGVKFCRIQGSNKLQHM